MVVGIGYITRAILIKSAAIKEGMASTLASRQASVLNAQAEYAEATAALNAAKLISRMCEQQMQKPKLNLEQLRQQLDTHKHRQG